MSTWAWRCVGTVMLAYAGAVPSDPHASMLMLGGIAMFVNAELDKTGVLP